MARVTFAKAVAEALAEEMRRDETVVLLGEDVRTGILGTTKGLVEEFGPARVLDTPISEAGFAGLAVGAAAAGLRPVVDLMYGQFTYLAMDQLANQAAKLRYMTGGQIRLPVTYLFVSGGGHRGAAQHSESPHGMVMNVPGLKVVVPGTGPDAKGLLKASIRDDNPVLYYMDFQLLRTRWDVPEGEWTVPLGRAEVKREGTDVTVVAVGGMVPKALAAAEALAEQGISVEVVDPRCLAPLDVDTVVASVRKTRRLVVADDAPPRAGAAAEIVAAVVEAAHDALVCPPRRVTRPPAPVPFNASLEDAALPSQEVLERTVAELVRR